VAAAMLHAVGTALAKTLVTCADNRGARVLPLRNQQVVHPPRRAIRN
jgi:hypothetical protein